MKGRMDYDSIASAYASHRKPVSPALREMRERAKLDKRSKVLEVGCGTCAHIASLVRDTQCSGLGIDPSPKMLYESAKLRLLNRCAGFAEKLPFVEDFFDLVFSVDVVHHLEDTGSYFGEAFRVLTPRGVVCTVTDSEEIIRNRKPLAVYWPATVQVDLARYPPIPLLREQMISAGFVDREESYIETPYEIADSTPYREKAYSCLRLISQEEFLIGLRRLEADLRKGFVQGVMQYVSVWGRKSGP